MFIAYQQCCRPTGAAGGSLRARIIRIGAAKRLAWVAPWAAAWRRNPLAENVCTRATDAPAQIADATL